MRESNNINKLNIRYYIFIICILGLALFTHVLSCTFMRYYSNVNAQVAGYAKENRSSTYNIVFNANGGTGTMSNQSISYGTSGNLISNAFSKDGYFFAGWNTNPDGSGTGYGDGAQINIASILTNNTLNLYATWTNGPVEINGTYYTSLNAAKNANAIPTDGTQVTINVLSDLRESITFDNGSKVILNLNNHIISNYSNNSAIIENNGALLTIQNGTIRRRY